MAVGQGITQDLLPVPGLRLATVSAGIKKPGRQDVVLFEIAEGSTVAGVYTRNAFCAAPVIVTKRHIAQGAPRYMLVNTGNANAGTGDAGLHAALACCEAVADAGGVAPERVLPFSTGVIGEALPDDKIRAVIPEAMAGLAIDGWLDAASGIMTTDTRPKGCSRRLELGGRTVTITGIAKGAGMIKPDMATMLAFIATDAAIGQETLQAMVQDLSDSSFNRITIDGDTSTNDCCMLVATGASGLEEVKAGDPALAELRNQLQAVFVELAQAIVRDGEGASKFVTVRVEQARDRQEALRVAYTIAESPLVKTALFASDPNWGRILAAVGRAGLEDLDIRAVAIDLGEVCIVRNGGVAPDYTEAAGAAVMAREEIPVTVRLGRGEAAETVWTTDLSHDYVTINAEYRT